MPLTITEALAEIKTINKRLEKKRQSVLPYLARDLRVKDPFESNGGSDNFISQERQAIGDLQTRIISIRTAIQQSNLTNSVSVNGQTKTVADWLTWRREISEGERNFLTAVSQGLKQLRNELQKKGGSAVSATAATSINYDPSAPPAMVVNIDEKKLLVEQENIETTLGELDGKLSLFNATTTIAV